MKAVNNRKPWFATGSWRVKSFKSKTKKSGKGKRLLFWNIPKYIEVVKHSLPHPSCHEWTASRTYVTETYANCNARIAFVCGLKFISSYRVRLQSAAEVDKGVQRRGEVAVLLWRNTNVSETINRFPMRENIKQSIFLWRKSSFQLERSLRLAKSKSVVVRWMSRL